MKRFKAINWNRRNMGLGSVIVLLVIITIGVIMSCGKLKNEEAPSTPTGNSSNEGAIPYGDQSTLGTMTVSLSITPDTIPADLVTFATVHAKLEDTSGRSMKDYNMEFTCELGVLQNEPLVRQSPSSACFTTGTTNQWGTISVYYFGARAGSEVIRACVDINDNGTCEMSGTGMATTAHLTVTAAPGVPGDGTQGIDFTSDRNAAIVDLGECDSITCKSEDFTLTATVWDKAGGRVGAGVQVELSSSDLDFNTIPRWALTDSNGQAKWIITHTICGVGKYEITATASVVIDGVTYSDPVSYTIYANCTIPDATPTPAPTATAVPTAVTLDLSPNLTTVPYGQNSTDITITAFINGIQMSTPITVQLTATGGNGTFSTNPVTFTGQTVVTFTLNPGQARPRTVTIYAGVTTTGYTGNKSVNIDFEGASPTPTPTP